MNSGFLSNVTKKNEILLLLIAIIIYSYSYYYLPDMISRPELSFKDVPYLSGWELWHDQGEYYLMSTKLATGSFNATYFIYPLGYPILGTPSALLGSEDSIFSHHRFFLPDLLMYLAVVYVTYQLTYRLTQSVKTSILSLAFLFFLTPYLLWFLQPWELHVVDVGLLGIFYLLFSGKEEVSGKNIMIAGLLAGWIFSARYLDVIWVLPVGLLFFISNPRKIKYLIPGVILVGAVFFGNFIFLGSPFHLSNEYESILAGDNTEVTLYQKVGLHQFDINPKIMANRTYCILIDPMHCLPQKTGDSSVDTWWYYTLHDKIPILNGTSWFLSLSPIGAYLLLRQFHDQQRKILVGLLIGFVLACIFYTSDWGFSSGWTIFFRYEMFWLPIFTIFSVYALRTLFLRLNIFLKKAS